MKILIAIIVFGVIIVIHEWGHFIAARLSGVKVNEFAIGMGPTLFKIHGKKTMFSLRLLPIGGYCAMEGEDTTSSDDGAFCSKSPIKRLFITAAGAVMNIILGFIIAIIVTAINGRVVTNQVTYFTDDAVSSSSGLQLDDVILKINGKKIFTANDIVYQLRNDVDGVVDMVVLRNGEKVKLDAVRFDLSLNTETGKQVINIDFKVKANDCTIANIIPYSFKRTVTTARLIWISLIDMISGKYGFNDIQGPVGIVTAIGEASEQSFSDLLDFMMLITVNVGIFNLLPLPALDGGRLVFIIVEMIRRKPVPPEKEGLVHFIGFAALMLLMVAVTFNDIVRLIK